MLKLFSKKEPEVPKSETEQMYDRIAAGIAKRMVYEDIDKEAYIQGLYRDRPNNCSVAVVDRYVREVLRYKVVGIDHELECPKCGGKASFSRKCLGCSTMIPAEVAA